MIKLFLKNDQDMCAHATTFFFSPLCHFYMSTCSLLRNYSHGTGMSHIRIAHITCTSLSRRAWKPINLGTDLLFLFPLCFSKLFPVYYLIFFIVPVAARIRTTNRTRKNYTRNIKFILFFICG